VSVEPPAVCPICGSRELERVFRWEEPPAGETRFARGRDVSYEREFWACASCGHLAGVTSMDLDALYSGDYVEDAYGEGGLEAAFEHIMALPPGQSDNAARAQRVDSFAQSRGLERELIDLGSGLGVFPAAMEGRGWRVSALDPDPRAVEHLRRRLEGNVIEGDALELELERRFDLVTLNKVLEHLVDPAELLTEAERLMAEDGVLYVEVPDGPAAVEAGPGREELFIEHLHAFSVDSLRRLADRCGLEPLELEAIHEPSNKYTLYGFLGRC
jgi:SAM-dependent methyltransferase